jgi:glucose-6-phosphate isomerase
MTSKMNDPNRSGLSREFTYPVLNMGPQLKAMKDVLRGLEKDGVVNRIWHKDHTVWNPRPAEISDRLGWLNVAETMTEKVDELNDFADEIKADGFRHVMLLGMGGSSLGPEVFRTTFGSSANYPSLIVLDSTVPSRVKAVARSIEPRRTLFLVSSKSGTTMETNSLYRYFRGLVEKEVGLKKTGRNFAAITDPQTVLSRLAHQDGFRHTFLNPADIGGRYSVLSYFGLVPAALTGMDLNKLIESATRMQEGCAPWVDINENAGAWLGTLIANCALHGRDKLTFIVSPAIRSFGLWVEQLLAESLGKEGKGIVPVIDEPFIEPGSYGDDRLFVYIRLNGDRNSETDEAIMRLETGGQPVIQLQIGNQYELGAEFFRWEFAAAIAGAVLGVNPFDQPDVQATKESTRQVIAQWQEGKEFPEIKSTIHPETWLAQARLHNYLAIMAFIKQTPVADRAFAEFRQKMAAKYHIATTLGYGPRFLHSTGQLHKGGPNSGLFIQVTARARGDRLSIPGERYALGELTAAEATGDFNALESKGRKVIRVVLPSASGKAVREIFDIK